MKPKINSVKKKNGCIGDRPRSLGIGDMANPEFSVCMSQKVTTPGQETPAQALYFCDQWRFCCFLIGWTFFIYE
jgi:hypothetical protein